VKRLFISLCTLIFVFLPSLSMGVSAAHGEFIDEGPEIGDYDFSVVLVPDTQVVTYVNRDSLHYIYDWIIDNTDSKKIEFVIGLGDMTEKSSYAEWWEVEKQVDRLNGVVPYALVRGNHDKTLDLNKFFPKAETPHIEGTYDPWINNSWRTVRMGDYDYLIMTLDYGADDDMLAWASGVIKDHPDHNVIIATHSYLFNDGTTLDAGDLCPPSKSGGTNDGDDMWEKLIRKHENITLVVCGHDSSDRIVYRQDKGDHGNTVTQMLIDAQDLDRDTKGAAGMIAIAYFSNGGKNVQIEYYSTIRQQWFMEENQFSIELDVVPSSYHPAENNWTVINILIVSGVIAVSCITIVLILLINDKKRKAEEINHESIDHSL